MSKLPSNGYLLGLDVGEKRIGVALASVIARLPQPLELISNNGHAFEQIASLAKEQSVELIVIGIPRNLQGEETEQSESIRLFAQTLSEHVSVAIEFADESLSSVRADEVIKQGTFKEASRDSLAACFILEEYIQTAASSNTEEQ